MLMVTTVRAETVTVASNLQGWFNSEGFANPPRPGSNVAVYFLKLALHEKSKLIISRGWTRSS
jgi:hypothetical protein